MAQGKLFGRLEGVQVAALSDAALEASQSRRFTLFNIALTSFNDV